LPPSAAVADDEEDEEDEEEDEEEEEGGCASTGAAGAAAPTRQHCTRASMTASASMFVSSTSAHLPTEKKERTREQWR